MRQATAVGIAQDDHPLPPPSPGMVMATPEMFMTEQPDSYQAIPGHEGAFMRELAIDHQTRGLIGARILRLDPAAKVALPKEPWHLHKVGIHIGYVLRGRAVIEFEGVGEVEATRGTIMYQPPRNRHRAVEVSPDFMALEVTLPAKCEMVAFPEYGDTLPPRSNDMTLATPDMFRPLRDDSFQRLPGFAGVEVRPEPGIRDLTGGLVDVLVLRADKEVRWAGAEWHMHHFAHGPSYIVSGWADFEFDGVGKVRFEEGTFFNQPALNRHHEGDMSPDFEAIGFAIPAGSATTVFPFNHETQTYGVEWAAGYEEMGAYFEAGSYAE